MSQIPRVLIISSCSDTKTQPPGDLWKRTRQIKKQLTEVVKLPQTLTSEGISPSSEVQHNADHLRSELKMLMLLEDDFEKIGVPIPSRAQELSVYSTTAADMYAGDHHLELMRGIKLLRTAYGTACVDLKIISAAYGLLDEDQEILPYDVTFSGVPGHTLDRKAAALSIHSAVERAIEPYDLVIFLLGQEYLRSVKLPVTYDPRRQRLVFLASSSAQEFLDYDPKYGAVLVSNHEVRDFGSAAVSLKGKLFHLFAQAVVEQGWHLFDRIKDQPKDFLQILDPYRKERPSVSDEAQRTVQLNLFQDQVLAANRFFPMSYFMPENEDRVTQHFNPWTLRSETRKTGITHLTDSYAHEILKSPPWDGILISLHEVSGWPKTRREDLFRLGVRKYLRYGKDVGLTLGDCGAFTFDEKGEPPFTNRQVLEQYRALGLDMGVSVDFLIFPELWTTDSSEAKRRFECNLQSAQEFWGHWVEMSQESTWEFVPVGVAQGGTPNKLAEAVEKLQAIGYRFIAIGGLARASAAVIEKCLRAIAVVVHADTHVHLFGFGKLEHVKTYRELGVSAFDSTSSLLQAFTRGLYWDPEKGVRHWPAIRVPFTDGRRARALGTGADQRDLEESRKLEQATLTALRKFDQSESKGDLVAARNALVEYDLHLKPWPYNSHLLGSLQTLEERPWKRCDCAICHDWGIAVVLMRSNNHNRRRGFHNTWVFYQEKLRQVGRGLSRDQFRELLPGPGLG